MLMNKPNQEAAKQNRALFEDLRRLEQAGDKPGVTRARQAIVEANLGLVHWYAERYHWVEREGRLEMWDLVGAGVIGMYKAIDKYDMDRGFTFSTYARHWIHNHIDAAIRGTDIVKIYHGWLPKGSMMSLDAPARESDSARTRHEITAADGPGPEELVADLEEREIFGKASKVACRRMGSEKAAVVAVARFQDNRLMPDIARELGVSRQRVEQLEKRFVREVHRELGRTG